MVRPYPSQYCQELQLQDGTVLDVRPIRAEDEPLLARFHFTLSEESVYLRYFAFLTLESRIAHERLIKRCTIDYDHEMAYVALVPGEREPSGELSPSKMVGVGRVTEWENSGKAEIAVVVSDAYQHHGIGQALVHRIIDFAREKKFIRLSASILPENSAIQRLLEHEGFKFTFDENEELMNGKLFLK